MKSLSRKTIVIVILVTTRSAGYSADPAIEAAEANASSIGAIHTLYAKVHFQVVPGSKFAAVIKQTGPTLIFSGEYWQEPGTVRVRQICEKGFKGQVIEFLRENGKTRAITRRPGPQPNTIIASLLVAGESRRVIMTDVWKLGLLGLPPRDSENTPVVSVAEAVQRMKVDRVKIESGPKGPLTRITLNGGDAGIYTIWLDPGVNWLIRKMARDLKGGLTASGRKLPPNRIEYEVVDFAEVRPAIYFPTKVVLRGFVDGEQSVTQEAVFTSVKVNELKSPPFPMRLPYAAGMAATDEVAGTTYITDANGNPSGKQTVLRYAPVNLPDEHSPQEARVDPFTLPEPSIWSQLSTWLIMASVCFTLAAGILAFRRRRAALSS